MATGQTDEANRTEPLKAERDRFVALSFCWADLLLEIDRNLTIVFAAGATAAFTGYDPRAIKGKLLTDIVAPSDVSLAGQLFKMAIKRGRIDNEMLHLRGPASKLLAMSLAGYCLDSTAGNFYLALRMAGGEAKAAAAQVPRDEASGLYTGDTFTEVAADRLKKMAERGEKAEVSMIHLPGITDLKKRLDPEAEKSLLHTVGACLKANSVGGDTAVTVGDGRYSLIHQAGVDVAEIAGQIEEFARLADPTGEGIKVESATIVVGDANTVSEEDLAKGLMYTLNQFRDAAGKDFSIRNLSANINSLVGEAVKAVNDFRRVVSFGEFDVALQPIVDVNNGDIHHYEALCRFRASDKDESPYRYITFAEETGLIHDFDIAMARKVVDWLGKMPRNSDKYRAAVNVSGFSVGKPSYVEALHQLIKENPWTKGKLMFEITESSRMSDLESANRFIQDLRKQGYHVCLDDFGAGAASFQYLSSLDVDVVKLDGSAVKNARRASKGRAFLSALTELCTRLGVETIAEMVDDVDGLEFVRECGCDYVQGYLFGKPSKEVRDFSPLPHISLFQPGAKRGMRRN